MTIKKIDNLGLISAYLTLGYDYIDRAVEGKKVYFLFEWDDEMDRIKDNFLNGRLEGDLKSFNDNLRRVKTVIYESIK